eukprot:1157328-Pelagomonas_calceolata.AAC.15
MAGQGCSGWLLCRMCLVWTSPPTTQIVSAAPAVAASKHNWQQKFSNERARVCFQCTNAHALACVTPSFHGSLALHCRRPRDTQKYAATCRYACCTTTR